ncbi:predicted protein [Histoplasma capsulatum var. duboisii H88]|uniref:Predicted protein n=1 Tax=Ajellomyces capsulatus (strain H88) TaxID=544711 RepID=F0U630_AJEC8|nr:predicted protein [Histoplasma capsulatum var. duboisii H88]
MVVKKVVVTKETTWKRDGNKKKKKKEKRRKRTDDVVDECRERFFLAENQSHKKQQGNQDLGVHDLGVAGVCAEPQSAAQSWRGILCMPYGVYGVYNTPSRGLMSLPDALRHAAWRLAWISRIYCVVTMRVVKHKLHLFLSDKEHLHCSTVMRRAPGQGLLTPPTV